MPTVTDVAALGGTFPQTTATRSGKTGVRRSGFTTTFAPDTIVLATVGGVNYDVDWTNEREGKSTTAPHLFGGHGAELSQRRRQRLADGRIGALVRRCDQPRRVAGALDAGGRRVDAVELLRSRHQSLPTGGPSAGFNTSVQVAWVMLSAMTRTLPSIGRHSSRPDGSSGPGSDWPSWA